MGMKTLVTKFVPWLGFPPMEPVSISVISCWWRPMQPDSVFPHTARKVKGRAPCSSSQPSTWSLLTPKHLLYGIHNWCWRDQKVLGEILYNLRLILCKILITKAIEPHVRLLSQVHTCTQLCRSLCFVYWAKPYCTLDNAVISWPIGELPGVDKSVKLGSIAITTNDMLTSTTTTKVMIKLLILETNLKLQFVINPKKYLHGHNDIIKIKTCFWRN